MSFEKLLQQVQTAHAEEVRQAVTREAAKGAAREEGIAAREKNLNAILAQRDQEHAGRKARIVTLETEAKVAAKKLDDTAKRADAWEKSAKAAQADVARLNAENKELKTKAASPVVAVQA